MAGNDVLYGDGQNDIDHRRLRRRLDLGREPATTASSATTAASSSSRVGTAEPLYGIAVDPAAAEPADLEPGERMQQAIINALGALRYTADLTPDNLIRRRRRRRHTNMPPAALRERRHLRRPRQRLDPRRRRRRRDPRAPRRRISGYADNVQPGRHAAQHGADPRPTSRIRTTRATSSATARPRPSSPNTTPNDPFRRIRSTRRTARSTRPARGRNWFLNFDSDRGPDRHVSGSAATTYAGVADRRRRRALRRPRQRLGSSAEPDATRSSAAGATTT